jgi:acyl CoA:acetate/3-ketoacid CoA transferase
MNKLVSPAQAVARIADGAVVTVSSSSSLGCPDLVLRALGDRFRAEGHPRGLTTLHPIAAGDMYGVPGMEHLAQDGLLSRVLAGSYPSGPSSLPMPEIWRMIVGAATKGYKLHDRVVRPAQVIVSKGE